MWLKLYLWDLKRCAGKSAVAELHAVLKKVKRHAEEGDDSGMFNKGTGICSNVHAYVLCHEARTLFVDIMRKWPNRYEDEAYPVGGGAEFAVNNKHRKLWENPRRMELLNWLIEVTT